MKGKELLTRFDDGNHLFHGSDKKIKLLEPRQAYDWISGRKKKDGQPAVFATDMLDRAIFMALLRNIPGEHGSTLRNNKTILRIDREKQGAINRATDLRGYVMVLPKDLFEKSGNDYRAESPVKPISIVEVSEKDLPGNLELIEE